jgi:NAD(P)-dependent dehydrogenase (short-subunit alcohol dehydrogenase family)
MDIKGSVALVTGSNRGIGRCFVEALLARGAAKVYASARRPERLADLVERHKGRVVRLKLDITVPADIAAAASQCGDVNLLVNNAGVNLQAGLVMAKDLAAARAEMETNYFGPLAMCRAFAPILASNGGGAIINMLSILARVNLPMYGSLSASKAAALSLTQGVRAELAKQGTLVVAVMPGAVDTEMEHTRGLVPCRNHSGECGARLASLALNRWGAAQRRTREMRIVEADGLPHEVVIELDDGTEIWITRYEPDMWLGGAANCGDIADGQTLRTEEGAVITRHGNEVVWRTPAKVKAEAA